MVRGNILKLLLVLFVYSGCFENKKKQNNDIIIEKKDTKNNVEIYKCMLKNDTIFSAGTFLKYIVVDSFYTVQISIKGVDTIMGYQFNCNSPHKYVPRFYYNDDNSIYLTVHSSPNYREIIVCELINNGIQINRFNMERSADSNKDIYVYRLDSDKTKLIIKGKFNLAEDIDKDSNYNKITKSISIPKEYQEDTIKITEVLEDGLKIHFTNDKELVLPFK